MDTLLHLLILENGLNSSTPLVYCFQHTNMLYMISTTGVPRILGPHPPQFCPHPPASVPAHEVWAKYKNPATQINGINVNWQQHVRHDLTCFNALLQQSVCLARVLKQFKQREETSYLSWKPQMNLSLSTWRVKWAIRASRYRGAQTHCILPACCWHFLLYTYLQWLRPLHTYYTHSGSTRKSHVQTWDYWD